MTGPEHVTTSERADLLEALTRQRHLLRLTVRDLTDEQAARQVIANTPCLGDLIKTIINVEQTWLNFILAGVEGMIVGGRKGESQQFQPLEGDTLAGLLFRYSQVAARTDQIVSTLTDLDAPRPLPDAPWIEPGTNWSARRVILEVIVETSRSAARADIVRVSVDNAYSVG
ncbi:MAG: DUF664 domain-containing protein [Frankia sp.]